MRNSVDDFVEAKYIFVEAKIMFVDIFAGMSSTSSSDISSDMSSGRRDNTGRPASPTRKPNQSEQSVQSPNPSPASPGQHVSSMILSKAFSDHPMLIRLCDTMPKQWQCIGHTVHTIFDSPFMEQLIFSHVFCLQFRE